MRKFLAVMMVVFIIFVSTPTVWGQLSQTPPTQVKMAKILNGTPVIDGEIDEMWGYAHRFAGHIDMWEGGTPSSAYTDMRMMWDETHLYVLAEVTDPHVGGLNEEALHMNDSLEIYIDQLNKKSGDFELNNSFRLNIDYLGRVQTEHSRGTYNGGGVEAATTITDYGYVIEASIKWVGDFKPTAEHIIGLEFWINDNALGGYERTGWTNWHNPDNSGWKNPKVWATATLTSDLDKAVPSDKPAGLYDDVEFVGSVSKEELPIITLPPWTSELYPEDWEPGFKDSEGRFLHDFSYAGYHMGEKAIPDEVPGKVYNVVTQYGADSTGVNDSTDAIQKAIDDVGIAGGGVVFLPTGTYKVSPPASQGGGSRGFSLKINKSGVVLRGEGTDKTFIFNDAEEFRHSSVILIEPSPSARWAYHDNPNSIIKIPEDVFDPAFNIAVEDASSLKVGDWVVVGCDMSNEFITEHNMDNAGDPTLRPYWNTTRNGVAFYRQIEAIEGNTITIDIPTRYPLKTRDNAKMYKVTPHIEEVGVEYLSIGMRQSSKPGLGDASYNTIGTAAHDAHVSMALYFNM